MSPPPLLPIVRTVRDLRRHVAEWRMQGLKIALTPTMGALHAGHLSLIKTALRSADRVIATIFVNPSQFGPNEDFAAYPRAENTDAALLTDAGCDLLYAPSVYEMYPEDFSTEVGVTEVTDCLCGAHRPTHFDGVTTVVAKLLNQALPDMAVFGEKDWQQLTVIRRMARDLDMPIRIVGSPTLREKDGLAMSSRNRYLSAEQRAIASRLFRTLREAAAVVREGVEPAKICEASAAALVQAGFNRVDYFELRHPDTLRMIETYETDAPARLFAAAHLGKARLIDNLAV